MHRENRKTNEEFNKVFMFFMSLLILVSLTVSFSYVWLHINEGIIWAFDTRGNYLIVALYFMMQYLFSRVYGALKIGFYKVSDIVYSQALTTVIVDVLMYMVMSLVARELVAFLPMLALLGMQLVIIVVVNLCVSLIIT